MMKRLLLVAIMFMFFFSVTVGGQGIARAAEPIKIGFLGPFVGVSSKYGADLRDGWKLALEEVNYKVAGRDIVFIPEDDELKPDVGLTKTRKLVEKDQVHILGESSAVQWPMPSEIM